MTEDLWLFGGVHVPITEIRQIEEKREYFLIHKTDAGIIVDRLDDSDLKERIRGGYYGEVTFKEWPRETQIHPDNLKANEIILLRGNVIVPPKMPTQKAGIEEVI